MNKVLKIVRNTKPNFKDIISARNVANHLMSYKHSLDASLTLRELELVNDVLFFIAESTGLSLQELVGEPEVPSHPLE